MPGILELTMWKISDFLLLLIIIQTCSPDPMPSWMQASSLKEKEVLKIFSSWPQGDRESIRPLPNQPISTDSPILPPGFNKKQTSSHFTSKNLWSDAIVPYRVDKSLSKPRRLRLIQDVIGTIQNVTCIRFVDIGSMELPIIPHLYMTVGDTCSSFIGRQVGSERQNLTLTRMCMSERGVAHELVHALGFAHEQARMDRDDFVTLDLPNIQHDYAYTFEKEPDGHQLLGYTIPYDFSSIMHYGPYDFAVDQEKPTLKSRISPFFVRWNSELSFLDIYKINLLYKCRKEIEIFSTMCVDYLWECFWLSDAGQECQEDYVRRVCRKRCGMCRATK